MYYFGTKTPNALRWLTLLVSVMSLQPCNRDFMYLRYKIYVSLKETHLMVTAILCYEFTIEVDLQYIVVSVIASLLWILCVY